MPSRRRTHMHLRRVPVHVEAENLLHERCASGSSSFGRLHIPPPPPNPPTPPAQLCHAGLSSTDRFLYKGTNEKCIPHWSDALLSSLLYFGHIQSEAPYLGIDSIGNTRRSLDDVGSSASVFVTGCHQPAPHTCIPQDPVKEDVHQQMDTSFRQIWSQKYRRCVWTEF